MKKVYAGWVSECPYDFVAMDADKASVCPKSIAETVMHDWPRGTVVAVRYYVSDAPMTEAEAVEKFIVRMFYGGELDSRYVLDAYSEYTINEWEEELKVGGHDLAEELRTYVGKYVVLVIETATSRPS